MADIFYTFEHDGERHDLECTTQKAVEEWADEWFSERCHEGDRALRNGESFSDEGFIIKYQVDDDGVVTDLERTKYALEYEYYHGDYAEHNTHWGL